MVSLGYIQHQGYLFSSYLLIMHKQKKKNSSQCKKSNWGKTCSFSHVSVYQHVKTEGSWDCIPSTKSWQGLVFELCTENQVNSSIQHSSQHKKKNPTERRTEWILPNIVVAGKVMTHDWWILRMAALILLQSKSIIFIQFSKSPISCTMIKQTTGASETTTTSTAK